MVSDLFVNAFPKGYAAVAAASTRYFKKSRFI